MRWALALALMALAGCGQQTAPEPHGGASSVPSVTPAPAAQSPLAAVELPGEYRIAGVDGQDIDLPHAITASIDAARIRVDSGCLRREWNYTQANGRLATTPRELAVPSCVPGLRPEEAAVFAAFDAAQTAVRTPANAIEIAGGGHTVTLFSQ